MLDAVLLKGYIMTTMLSVSNTLYASRQRTLATGGLHKGHGATAGERGGVLSLLVGTSVDLATVDDATRRQLAITHAMYAYCNRTLREFSVFTIGLSIVLVVLGMLVKACSLY